MLLRIFVLAIAAAAFANVEHTPGLEEELTGIVDGEMLAVKVGEDAAVGKTAEPKKAVEPSKEDAHKGMALGEDATAKAGFPGPFAPKRTESIGTAGYTVAHNYYNDLETTAAAIDCGGDQDGGKVQSYAESSDDPPVPNLDECRDKCNACVACTGWIDMFEDRQCHFMASLDYTRVSPNAGIEAYKRYWNTVKTYEQCPLGNYSENEAPFTKRDTGACKGCSAGWFNSHETMTERCVMCEPGKIANPEVTGIQSGTCQNCPAGRYSNHAENNELGTECLICPIKKYSDEGKSSCTDCPAGTYGNFAEATGNGNEGRADECQKCEVGKWQETPGQIACLTCDEGKYSAPAGQTNCKHCDRGYWAQASMSSCVNCENGKSSYPVRGECYDCPAGKFSVSAWPKCLQCAKGKYSAPTQSACTDCMVGRHTDTIETKDDCKQCLAGRFAANVQQHTCDACVKGTYSHDGQSVCLDCQVGRATGDPGSGYECAVCHTGRYADQVGMTTCTNCAKGTVQPEEEKTGCIDCEVGKFMATERMAECEKCELGMYQDQTAQSLCLACAAGHFAEILGHETCKLCSTGQWNEHTESTRCFSCVAGTHTNVADSATVCIDCAVGKFSPHTQRDCTDCAAGKFAEETGTGDDCPSCPGGFYADSAGLSVCDACAAGAYQNLEGQDQCKLCDNGKFSIGAAVGTLECTNCEHGTVSESGQSDSENAACTPCATGYYSYDRQASACLECDPGKFMANTGAIECENCVAGKFQADQAKDDCVDCPDGKRSRDDASERNDCDACGPGWYSPSHKESCEECPGMFYSDTDDGSGNNECTECASGKVAGPGETVCVTCPAGRSAPYEEERVMSFRKLLSMIENGEGAKLKTGTNVEELCQSCDAGQYAGDAGAGCINCEAGKFSADTAPSCTLCGAGHWSYKGAASCTGCATGRYRTKTGGNRPLSCMKCNAGKISAVASAVCAQCPAGKRSNDPNNRASCVLCGTGQYSVHPTADNCKGCWAGSYQNQQGKETCIDCGAGQASEAPHAPCENCAAGKFQAMQGSTAYAPVCTDCDRGRYASGTGNDECFTCPNGQHSLDKGSGSCQYCGTGHIANPAKTDCEACAVGKYKVNNEACGNCGLGYYSLGAQNSCSGCSPGWHAPGTQAGCQKCDTGKVSSHNWHVCGDCSAGQVARSDQAACVNCAPGKYKPSSGPNACTDAPAGHYVWANHPNFQTYSQCAQGYYQDQTGGDNCKLCGGANQYQDLTGQTSCKTCPGNLLPSTTRSSCEDPPPVCMGFEQQTNDHYIWSYATQIPNWKSDWYMDVKVTGRGDVWVGLTPNNWGTSSSTTVNMRWWGGGNWNLGHSMYALQFGAWGNWANCMRPGAWSWCSWHWYPSPHCPVWYEEEEEEELLGEVGSFDDDPRVSDPRLLEGETMEGFQQEMIDLQKATNEFYQEQYDDEQRGTQQGNELAEIGTAADDDALSDVGESNEMVPIAEMGLSNWWGHWWPYHNNYLWKDKHGNCDRLLYIGYMAMLEGQWNNPHIWSNFKIHKEGDHFYTTGGYQNKIMKWYNGWKVHPNSQYVYVMSWGFPWWYWKWHGNSPYWTFEWTPTPRYSKWDICVQEGPKYVGCYKDQSGANGQDHGNFGYSHDDDQINYTPSMCQKACNNDWAYFRIIEGQYCSCSSMGPENYASSNKVDDGNCVGEVYPDGGHAGSGNYAIYQTANGDAYYSTDAGSTNDS